MKQFLIVVILIASFLLVYQSRVLNQSGRSVSKQTQYNFDTNVDPMDKATIKKAIKSGKSYPRKLYRELSGSILFYPSSEDDFSLSRYRPSISDYPLQVTYAGVHLYNNKDTEFVVWHELGHLIDWSGISVEGKKAFTKEFKKSDNWKNCFKPSETIVVGNKVMNCTNRDEIFADNFGFYATGQTTSESAYNVPKLIGEKRMTSLLKKYYKPWSVEGKKSGLF